MNDDCTCGCHSSCISHCSKCSPVAPFKYKEGDKLEITIVGTVTYNGRRDAIDLVYNSQEDDGARVMYLTRNGSYHGSPTEWFAASKVRKLPPPQPSGIGAVIRLTTNKQSKGLLFMGDGFGKWRRVSDGCTFGWDQICKDGEITLLTEGYVE